MFAWFAANVGTLLVLAVLAVAVLLIVLSMRKDKRQGKLSCGGNCRNCAGCAAHPKPSGR